MKAVILEWNCYFAGTYAGTVHAATEEEARCAALSRFGDDERDDGRDDANDLSVSPR